MNVTAFLGTRGVLEYNVVKDGAPYDLQANGVVKVQVVDSGASIDTTTDAVTMLGSKIAVKWQELNLPADEYNPTIYVYEAGDTEGEAIIGPGLEHEIVLTLVEDERP